MPKLDTKWYKRKKPHLQIGILKSIALSGLASQKEITSQFGYKPSALSDALIDNRVDEKNINFEDDVPFL